MKSMKDFSQDKPSPGRDLTYTSSEYKSKVLPFEQFCLVYENHGKR
jgi:hypothetical protein